MIRSLLKNIYKLPSKIQINFSTYITIIISLLINRHRLLFLQFLIAFIHELFHCIGAFIFKLNINKLVMLPFGFYADIDNLYSIKWYQELIIIILGPLSYLISSIIINLLFINNSISLTLFNEIKETNLLILIFNLLPIFPLDGYRIIKILLGTKFSEKKVLKIMNIISLFFTSILLIYCIFNSQLFIISFLIFNQIVMIKSFKNTYKKFLVSKTKGLNLKRYKIHFIEDLYRPFNNIVINNNKVYSEEEFSLYLIKKNLK